MSDRMIMQPTRDVWPADQEYLRPIIATCYLVAVAILSALLARRWISWKYMKRLPIAKLLVIAVLGDSFLFVILSAVLILGVGSSYSPLACAVGIWWCIILYASSKVLIYSFLSEKLYAVYSATPTRRIPRWQSTQYKIAIAFLVLWLGVAVVMIVGRISKIRENDQACVIGLKLWSTVPMLAVDAIVNIYLTAAFVIPVYRSRWNKAQQLALSSSLAAVAALVTSFANIAVLTVQHGHQLSWVCLGSCGLDVFINAVILYIVTRQQSSDGQSSDPTSAIAAQRYARDAGKNGTSLGGANFGNQSRRSGTGGFGGASRDGGNDNEMVTTGDRRPSLAGNPHFESSFSITKKPVLETSSEDLEDEQIESPVIAHTLSFNSDDIERRRSSTSTTSRFGFAIPKLPNLLASVPSTTSTTKNGTGSPLSTSRPQSLHLQGRGTGIMVSEEIVSVREEGIIERDEEWKDSERGNARNGLSRPREASFAGSMLAGEDVV